MELISVDILRMSFACTKVLPNRVDTGYFSYVALDGVDPHVISPINYHNEDVVQIGLKL